MKIKTLTPNLLVEDVDATIAYFERVLLAKKTSSVPFADAPDTLQWASVTIGDVEIMFQARRNFETEFPHIKGMKTGGSQTFFCGVEDIETLFAHVKKEKADVLSEIYTTFYGSKEFAMKDCNGYFFVFAQHGE